MEMEKAIEVCKKFNVRCKRVDWKDKFLFIHNIYFGGFQVASYVSVCEQGKISKYNPTEEDENSKDWVLIKDGLESY